MTVFDHQTKTDIENAPDFLTPQDLIRILPFGRDKVYQIIRSSSFPAIQFGRTYVVRKSDFEKWWEGYIGKKFII